MFVKTSNAFGDITIDNNAIAVVAGFNALECYGVVDLVSKSMKENFGELFKNRSFARGVKIVSVNNHITVDLNVILKYGISITAVADSLKSTVKYSVEKFTGMIVDAVNIKVIGVRV
ncbi:MAG: Asp23/Gls24 family envelope stress response protein [Clostridia bacterium]|nr:Asp23/Gls24 family envelope stress response protein [Clostridia bacterium]